jgi:hypothetical protein
LFAQVSANFPRRFLAAVNLMPPQVMLISAAKMFRFATRLRGGYRSIFARERRLPAAILEMKCK